MRKANRPKPLKLQDAIAKHQSMDFPLAAVFAKSVDALPASAYFDLNALRLYFGFTHNGYVLAEALALCLSHKVNPPIWVLQGLSDGLEKFKTGHVTLQGALELSKRDQTDYEKFRTDHPVMRKVRKRMNKGEDITPACKAVAVRHDREPDALIKAYRRGGWEEFFDYVSGK
jgi:hypothetical protein